MNDHDLLKEINKNVNDMRVDLAVHTSIIKEHERRSIALEQRQEVLGAEINERLKPIQKHVDVVSIILKAGGAIAVAVLIKIVMSSLGILD